MDYARTRSESLSDQYLIPNKNVRISINNILSSQSKFSYENLKKVISSPSKWSPPLGGSIKFNTCGVVVGSFGAAGIGGCICNEKGKILIYFSKSVGFTDSTSVELLAILEACHLLSNSIWSLYVSFTLECDSKLTVEWLCNRIKLPSLGRFFNETGVVALIFINKLPL
ncbi:hypothetical protein GQ457_12G006870 [Hibiscus cannabinus]